MPYAQVLPDPEGAKGWWIWECVHHPQTRRSLSVIPTRMQAERLAYLHDWNQHSRKTPCPRCGKPVGKNRGGGPSHHKESKSLGYTRWCT